MSHPSKKKLFDAWYKAMIAGATVDKPDYGKTHRGSRKKRIYRKPSGNRRLRRGHRKRRYKEE